MVKLDRVFGDFAVPGLLDFGDVPRHAPEHLLHGLGGLAVVPAADVTLHQHLAGIVGQLHFGKTLGHRGRGQQAVFCGWGDLCGHGKISSG